MTDFHKPGQPGEAAALPKGLTQSINLRSIRIDGGTQSRAELNHATVDEYSEAMAEGDTFPPIVVFFDGSSYWLADGFHRYFGADHAGMTEIQAEVLHGTQQDAQLFSFSVNAAHGLRRTNADKRKAVMGALQHPVSGQWSDRQIAKHCGVSDKTVAAVRKSIFGISEDVPPSAGAAVRQSHFGNSEVTPAQRTYTTKHGTTAVMNTANIGKTDRPALAPAKAAVPAPAPRPVVVVPPPPSSAAPDPWASLPKGDNTVPEGINPDDYGPSEEEIAAAEAEEKAERELVAKMIAADDVVAELAAEVKRLIALNEGLNRRIDSLMREKSDAITWMKKYEAQNRRLFKELETLKKGAAQ